jgi:hypothetical protein
MQFCVQALLVSLLEEKKKRGSEDFCKRQVGGMNGSRKREKVSGQFYADKSKRRIDGQEDGEDDSDLLGYRGDSIQI